MLEGEIYRRKQLPEDKLTRILERIRNGDKNAREELIESYQEKRDWKNLRYWQRNGSL